jgi:predicted TIM-barrel fold metal-dependent hydrolase
MVMKTITLEEHFVTQGFLNATSHDGQAALPEVHEKLLNLGEGRLAAMDAGGVDMQVLSLEAMSLPKLAAEDETSVLRDVHDELAAAVAAHPDRFAGFCTPPLRDVRAAVREVERCVTSLGFRGVMVSGMADGKFLDAEQFRPVLEAIAALDVPLYLHPAPPPQSVFDAYYSGLPDRAGLMLSIAGWGWHSETAIHVLRLIVSGMLERVPKLKVIIGHMGEGLPFALARSNAALMRGAPNLKRSVEETMREQVWITTSGVFTQPPFQCAADVLGLDRMMYSVDYPFSKVEQGEQFLKSLDLTEPERERFQSGLAAELLKIT